MKLYICGDSFCCADPEYPGHWSELIASARSDISIINLASPAASNYLIYLQVKHALENHGDYIIYNATSSIRQEFVFNKNLDDQDQVNRYWNLSDPDNSKSMISVSWPNPQNTASQVLDKKVIKTHSDYFTRFIDLPSLIEKNYIFIKHTLNILSSSQSKWVWNQGGFNHKNFGTPLNYNFLEYQNKESNINLWDYYNPLVKRPYYHVTDYKVHQNVCDYYLSMLQL